MTKDNKVLAGHKIRRLRHSHGLTQLQMASDLSISASYLNLIERNQRPISASVLLKLTQVYNIDLSTFAVDDEAETKARYEEIFNDPLFSDMSLRQQDYRDLVSLAPEVCDAMEKLYNAYKDQKVQISNREHFSTLEADIEDPVLETKQFFRGYQNYFETLEALAEHIRAEANIEQNNLYSSLCVYLKKAYRINVDILPFDVMQTIERRYDYHQRRLMINEVLPAHARNFQISVQLALIGYREQLELLIEKHGSISNAAKKLVRLGLANYLAGAILLPYQDFLQAARLVKYDLNLLASRFQVSDEQVRHRLTTLKNPDARGIPFFFLKIDKSGAVVKRISVPGMHFPRDGTVCPKWDPQKAFKTYPEPSIQYVQTQEGKRFLTVAHKVTKQSGTFLNPIKEYIIVMGCSEDYAKDWVYSTGVDLENIEALQIGPACKICQEENCSSRIALPQTGGRLSLDEYRRDQAPYRVIKD